MLIVFWLAITWLLYGDETYLPNDNPGLIGKLNLINKSKCSYFCAVADSVMMNILDNVSHFNSIGELHAKCGVTKFLINHCWNQKKYGSDCIPRLKKLRVETFKFSEKFCTESFYKKGKKDNSNEKPCFWRLSESEKRCSQEYIQLVGRFVDKNGSISQIEGSQEMNTICCEFTNFSKCAISGTSMECSIEIDDFVDRFLFKLGGKKIVDQCRSFKLDSVYKERCLNTTNVYKY